MNSSDLLIDKIESRIHQVAGWQDSIPVALGSWARGELCLKSDLDILFLGSEQKTIEIVQALQNEGYKVRARVPEDFSDWTVGVQVKDTLALLVFKALTPEGEIAAHMQRQQVLANSALCKRIFREVLKERKERNLKFDSLHNFLEPNLKLGPGGLRDIEQALQILPLVDKKNRLSAKHPAIVALRESKIFLLQIRQKLHEMGFFDQLIGSEQKELSEFFKFSSHKEFMRQVSKNFSRAHFYSGWIFEYFKASQKQRDFIESQNPKTAQDLMVLFREDSSLLMQRLVRSKMDQIHNESLNEPITEKQKGLLLREAILFRTKDSLTQAIFQSRWICKISPRIKPLVGYVQHDQYHRLAAEAHVLQACRELKRIWKSERLLGALSWVHKKLSAKDWEILSWVAFYHDIAKGQKGEHSVLGARAVREDLAEFEVNPSLIEKVAFLVENHLQLSIAAFRKNPQDPKTWQEFYSLGFDLHRVYLLAVFTAVDIRATNIEAWNQWKATLLSDAVKRFQDSQYLDLYSLTQKLMTEFSRGLSDKLDPSVIQFFSRSTVEKDLLSFRKPKAGETVKVTSDSLKILRDRKKKIWLRIRRKKDAAGLFERYVRAIFLSGASIEQALIQTLPEVGVYDLFQLKSHLSSNQLLKRIQAGLPDSAIGPSSSSLPPIQFNRIELVSESETEFILSFQGVDQRGLLWAIASELQLNEVSVISARVHTWGRQVDDLIHIKPIKDIEAILNRLRKKWVVDSGQETK